MARLKEIYEDGILVLRYRFDSYGSYNNPNYPSIETWYDNGIKKSEDWYVNSQFHRAGGLPARTFYYPDGIKQKEAYYLDGIVTNNNGPAICEYHRNGTANRVVFMKDSSKTNVTGPAVIYYDSSGNKTNEEYWVNDINYTKEDFEKMFVKNNVSNNNDYSDVACSICGFKDKWNAPSPKHNGKVCCYKCG